MASSLQHHLNGASQIHITNPSARRTRPETPTIISCKKTGEEITSTQEKPIDHNIKRSSRRREVITGVAAAVTVLLSTPQYSNSTPPARAEPENNGWWLTGPLPVPTVDNKELANAETGSRSFLRDGIYMANVGVDGSAYRLREYAFDLLALGDLIGKDAWNYMRKYLCLKSTFMYYDFDKVISAAPVDQKKPLTDLANKLFDNVEQLEEAIKKHDDRKIQSCYSTTTSILEEVRTRMA